MFNIADKIIDKAKETNINLNKNPEIVQNNETFSLY